MSELREKIAKLIYEHELLLLNSSNRNEGPSGLDTADAILSLLDSLPTEFEAVRKCQCKFSLGIGLCGYSTEEPCLACHGTGEIVRPLTQKEVMEDYERRITEQVEGHVRHLYLSSGERVRRKK